MARVSLARQQLADTGLIAAYSPAAKDHIYIDYSATPEGVEVAAILFPGK